MARRLAVSVGLSFVVVPLLAAACGSFGAGDGTPPPPAPTPTPDSGGLPPIKGGPDRGLEVTVGDGKTTAFVMQGRGLTLPVKLTRRPSTTGPVTITVNKLPKDVVADPLIVSAGAVEATLTLHAASTSEQGPAPLEIIALEAGDQGAGASTKLSAFVRGTPGAVDTTFGVKGVVRHIFGAAQNAIARDLVVLSDDRVVAVADCSTIACLARTSPDGVIDTTYGTGGTGGLAIFKVGQALADATGGVMLSGNGGANTLQVGRVTENGQPDVTFGNGTGVAVGTRRILPSIGGTPDAVRPSFAIRKDGTIVVGFVWAKGGVTAKVGLTVLTAKGVSVTTFGTNGFHEGRNSGSAAPAIGVRANGNIWTAGGCNSGQQDAVTGDDDPAFGAGNNSPICGVSPSLGPGGAVALADGSIVSASNGAIGKWVPDGSRPDLTWGAQGIATINEDALPSVSVDNNGLVLVTLLRDGGLRFMRLTVGGAPDSTFGVAGTVVHSFGMKQRSARALIQKDGRIVVAGTEDFPDGSDVTLSRYWD